MADKTSSEAPSSTMRNEPWGVRHILEHQKLLKELLETARKGNEDIARRMRDSVGANVGHDNEHGAQEPAQLTYARSSKLLASPGTSYPIDSTDAEKSKNPTDEPIERLLVRAREDGYNNGWKAGKAVGYKIGREDGQDLGMMEGKKIGVAQGKEIGMAVGLAEGKLQSKDLAKRESWQDWAAWDAGFSQGLEIGKSNARHG